MDYPIKENYKLISVEKEIPFTYLSSEESQKINEGFKEAMIKAKREHIKNQKSSRLESSKIIFNA